MPPAKQEYIEVRGAAEHNLKRIDADIPKYKLVVFTGPSGSGKSSLAFDTIYAEGQRRYVESLSAYARQFLGQMEKPRYDHIRGLSPTISIEQKAASNNPRSTVGTITEIYDYLRVLWARIGEQRCHQCGKAVERLSAGEIVDRLMTLDAGTKFMLVSRLIDNRKGEYKDLLQEAIKEGFGRFRIDGEVVRDDALPKLDKKKKHTIDIVVDRLAAPEKADSKFASRLADSVETALKKGGGLLIVSVIGGEERLYSEHLHCHHCDIGFPELSPQSFSFNSPLGMCPDCNGLGTKPEMDPDLVVPDTSKSIRGGAIEPWAKVVEREDSWTGSLIHNLAKQYKIDLDKPWKKLPKKQRDIVMFGTGGKRIATEVQFSTGKFEFQRKFEGVLNAMYRRFRQTKSEGMRKYYMRYLSEKDCSTCGGRRLRPESEAVFVGGRSLPDLGSTTIREARDFVKGLQLDRAQKQIATEVLKEVDGRLGFLMDVGLGYLTLDRPGPSLSGGESQRIRLASQIGSELTGVLYILDEPSIGLHQRDNDRLLATLKRLRDIGNTVVVVEHDQETIEAADYVLDFGPGAGITGGEITFSGTPAKLARSARSVTGRYLSGRESIETPRVRRKGSGKKITVQGAREHNLKNVSADIPLETFVAVTGVSGAGKSTLINSVLFPALKREFHDSPDAVGAHKAIKGTQHIDKVIDIDQRPIGRTPRSNPATYTKVFDEIRKVFAKTAEARAYGYQPGRFSFNVKGGRCEACEGDGVRRIEMHFLADVFVPCEVCRGRRFNDATLRVRFKGYNIAEVLDLSVDEAVEVFANQPKVLAGIQTLQEVGLGLREAGPTVADPVGRRSAAHQAGA